MTNPTKKTNGFTLVELLVALVIVAVLATAVSTLLSGAARTNSYMLTQTTAGTQADFALRRLMHNLRTASALVTPTTTTAASSVTTVTQPDASNGGATYTVTYSLQGTDLVEDDPRYNDATGKPNVIATNVSSFSVTRSAASPVTVQVNLTVGGSPAVKRTVTVYCRNL